MSTELEKIVYEQFSDSFDECERLKLRIKSLKVELKHARDKLKVTQLVTNQKFRQYMRLKGK